MITANDQIDAIIRNALAEDIGSGDVTTLNTIPSDATLTGELLVKADGVVAGLGVFRRVFELVDPRVEVTPLAADGDASGGRRDRDHPRPRPGDPDRRAAGVEHPSAHVRHRDRDPPLRRCRGRHAGSDS
ncbi:MAG: hypothetical protein R2844_02335 [Caldilineales bacterium]